MTIDGKIRDQKLQYHINREAAKTSALSLKALSGKGEEILPPDRKKSDRNVLFLLKEKLLKHKQKRLKIKEKN